MILQVGIMILNIALNTLLDSVVLRCANQFAAMNKLKNTILQVGILIHAFGYILFESFINCCSFPCHEIKVAKDGKISLH